MLLEHRGELRADFQQFYTLDMEALLDAGEFGRAATLALNLPAESRIVRVLNPQAAWDTSAYLLAVVADHLSFMRYEQSGGKGKKPKPIERPKAKPQVKHRKLNMTESKRQSLLFGKRK